MQSFFVSSLLVVGIFSALVLIKERGLLFPLRLVCFFLAFAVVAMFNINWLLNLPFESWILIGLLLILILVAYFVFSKEPLFDYRQLKKDSRIWLSAFLLVLVGIVLAWFYFQQDWATPRYRTPDSGVHFLYGNGSAHSGLLPSFDKSSLYEASGNLPEFEFHQQSYLPGAAAIFAFLYQIIRPEISSEVFQFSNALGFALIVAYLVSLVWDRKIFQNKWPLILFFGLVSYFGITFNLLLASYSSQLWGFLFLLMFLDSFDSYLNRKENAIVPIFALSALFLTYFYWMPVAVLFVFFNLLQKRKDFFRILVVPAVSFLLGLGYVLTILKLKLVGYAAADGGFPFQNEILSDALFVLPFAIWQFARLSLRKNKKTEEWFVINFAGAIFLYGILLSCLYFFGRYISHYTAVKVSFAVVPVVWIVAIMFFAENFSKIGDFFITIKKSRKIRIEKKQWGKVLIFISLYLAVVAFSRIGENEWKFLALEKNNFSYIVKNEMPAVITREQLLLLDDLKNKHANLLQENRIFIVAPADTALWSFAYSGIWPRTSSLIPPEGPRKGTYTQMSFYSAWIGDYATWLNQDKNHALVFLNNDESDRWVRNSGFAAEDYEIAEKRGENALFVLPENKMTSFVIKKNEEDSIEQLVKEDVFSGEFVAINDVVTGVVVPLEFKKAQKKGFDLILTLYDDICEKDGRVIANANAKIKETKSGRKNAKVNFRFEKYLNNTKNQKFCFRVGVEGVIAENVLIDYLGKDVLYGYELNNN